MTPWPQTRMTKAAINKRRQDDMSKKITLTKWDVVESLKTEEDMALYLETCMEEGNPELVMAALGDIARARDIASLPKKRT